MSDITKATEYLFHDVLGWDKQPTCEQPHPDPIEQLLDMVEVIDDCPTCSGPIEVADYHEYGQCYACRMTEVEG